MKQQKIKIINYVNGSAETERLLNDAITRGFQLFSEGRNGYTLVKYENSEEEEIKPLLSCGSSTDSELICAKCGGVMHELTLTYEYYRAHICYKCAQTRHMLTFD